MRFWILLLAFLTLSFGCDKKDCDKSNCDYSVVIDNELFKQSSEVSFFINDATISEDCLSVEISSGGCDGNSWEVNLYDSEGIAESLPPQRFLRLDLKNEELCDAWITKSFSFDISELKVDGIDTFILNLEGYDKRIVY